jgi:phthalate 4,5-cis-dihydrodiol dehydrogenase
MDIHVDGKLRVGVAGLGRGFMLMLPTLRAHPRIDLVAAADPRAEAQRRFVAELGGRAYGTVEELCADPDVDAVYVATPHELHAVHATTAARAGKHLLVEKPMAVTLAECDAMIRAAEECGVQLIVGPSHSFDAPVLRARELIDSGAHGAVRMISALNYTDFLYRPRRPEELETAKGGGVVFSQGAHQVDVVRLLGGGRVRTVRAATGAWDPARPTEGAYNAFLTFDDGAFASLTYSGYAHFDSDEFCGWIGEMGHRKVPARPGTARALLRQAHSADEEASLKSARTYGAAGASGEAPVAHNHFGLVLVSCEHADLRATPSGVMVYADDEQRFEAVDPPGVPRREAIDELCDAVAGTRSPVHTGTWARATLEVCIAILQSAREDREIALRHQVSIGGASTC